VGLGFELRASCLQSKCSIAGDTPPVHFAMVIFRDGVLGKFAWLSLNHNPSGLSLPSSSDNRPEPPVPSKLVTLKE
jgi:hypothetical protein